MTSRLGTGAEMNQAGQTQKTHLQQTNLPHPFLNPTFVPNRRLARLELSTKTAHFYRIMSRQSFGSWKMPTSKCATQQLEKRAFSIRRQARKSPFPFSTLGCAAALTQIRFCPAELETGTLVIKASRTFAPACGSCGISDHALSQCLSTYWECPRGPSAMKAFQREPWMACKPWASGSERGFAHSSAKATSRGKCT